MPEKDNTGMGERIQSMVEDAVASMDFEQLNKNITGSIQSVFEELNIQNVWGGYFDGNRNSRRVLEKCGFVFHHTENHVVTPMGGLRTAHYMKLSVDAWLKFRKNK